MGQTLDILHTGHRYVAINKPAGIGVEKHFDKDTVEARAQVQWKRLGAAGPPFVGIVHRLDRPVSGCLLLARNKTTLRSLNAAFAAGEVEKTYWAATGAALPTERGTLRHFLGRDATRRRAVASDRPAPDRKESTLQYTLLRETGGVYLYEVRPLTGRFHQIRVQLAAAGAPIVGDGAYGSDQKLLPHTIGLHARGLAFPDPHTGERVTVEAPLPAYFPLGFE